MQTSGAHQGAPTGVLDRNALRELTFDLAFEVIAQLVLKVAIGATGPKCFADSLPDAFEPGHGSSRATCDVRRADVLTCHVPRAHVLYVENSVHRDGRAQP